MNGKLTVLVLIIYLTNCKCGLISSFNGQRDELNPENTRTRYREKREIDENGIKSNIRQPLTTDKALSLIDIENEGKLETETKQESESGARPNIKTKRCHSKLHMGPFYRPNLSKYGYGPLLLTKRDSKWDDQTRLQKCLNCRNKMSCKISDKCPECKQYCQYSPSDKIVGVSNRITPPNDKDNIFSKTLYPISTYKEGEAKDIICKLVGINDRTDIETVTIWVTTYTNNPPKILESMMSDQPKTRVSERDSNNNNLKHLTKPSDKKTTKIQSRFGDYDYIDDGPSKVSDEETENLRKNPDIIEGPPPLLGSKNNEKISRAANEDNEDTPIMTDPTNRAVITQPKQFEIDDDDEDIENEDNGDVENRSSSSNINRETVLPVTKPTLFERLQERTQQRLQKLPTLKRSRVKPDEKSISNLNKDNTGILPNGIVSKNIPNDDIIETIGNAPVKGPDKIVAAEGNEQMSKITDAIEEVKSMIQKIQDDTIKNSKGSLLGFPAPTNIPESTNHVHPAIPNHVVDNLKKVNQYLKNRAQDVLDVIKDEQQQLKQSQGPSQDKPKDEHSEIAKNIMSNLKKMPQFVLDRFQDSLNKFNGAGKVINDTLIPISDKEYSENFEIKERFGDDGANNDNPDIEGDNFNLGIPNSVTEVVNRNIDESTSSNLYIDNPTTKSYKSKLEQYLADIKEKRQRKYSPEKYSILGKANKFRDIKNLNSVQPNLISSRNGDVPETDQESTTNQLLENLNKQKLQLKDKINSFIEAAKVMKSSRGTSRSSNFIPSSIKGITEETTNNLGGLEPNNLITIPADRPLKFLPTISTISRNKETGDTVTPNTLQKYIDKLKLKWPTKASLEEPTNDNVTPNTEVGKFTDFLAPRSNFLQDDDTLLEGNNEQAADNLLGSRLDNNLPYIKNGQNDGFPKLTVTTIPTNQQTELLPTIPTSSKNQESGKEILPNKFQKYFDKLKSRLPSKISSEMPVNQQNFKIKKYNISPEAIQKGKEEENIEYLENPNVATGPYDHDNHPNINNGNLNANRPNIFNKMSKNNFNSRFSEVEPPKDNEKKKALKKKIEDFLSKLKNPSLNKNVPIMRNRLNPITKRVLPTKSLERQKSELNTMVDNLKNLLTDKLPKDSEPTLYEVVKGELPRNVHSDPLIQSDEIIGAREPQIIKGHNDNTEIAQVEPTLNSRSGFADESHVSDDWSNSLGKIVSGSSDPNEVFFIGNGIKLPMKLNRKDNGALDLSVDIEKLCSCKNSSCTKNSAVIEKTVGEILEREAELEDQLQSKQSQDQVNSARFSRTSISLLDDSLSGIRNYASKGHKSELSKRSPDINSFNNDLLNNIKGKTLNQDVKIPILPNLQNVLKDITNLGKQLGHSLNNSVHEMKDSMNEINKKASDKNNKIYKNDLTTPSLTDIINNDAGKLNNYLNEINSNILKKINYDNKLNKFIKQTGLPELNKQKNYLQTQKEIWSKLPIVPAISSLQIFDKSPFSREIVDNIYNNVKNVQEAYQMGQVNSLRKKLNDLDDQVEQFNDNNEKMLAKSSKKLFAGQKNNIVDKEVNFIKKILSWMKDLTTGIKEK